MSGRGRQRRGKQTQTRNGWQTDRWEIWVGTRRVSDEEGERKITIKKQSRLSIRKHSTEVGEWRIASGRIRFRRSVSSASCVPGGGGGGDRAPPQGHLVDVVIAGAVQVSQREVGACRCSHRGWGDAHRGNERKETHHRKKLELKAESVREPSTAETVLCLSFAEDDSW